MNQGFIYIVASAIISRLVQSYASRPFSFFVVRAESWMSSYCKHLFLAYGRGLHCSPTTAMARKLAGRSCASHKASSFTSSVTLSRKTLFLEFRSCSPRILHVSTFVNSYNAHSVIIHISHLVCHHCYYHHGSHQRF